MNNSEKIMIDINQLDYAYEQEKILDKLSLRLAQGTITGLLGENGSGKTTLIHCLLGLLKPLSGTSTIAGENSRELSANVRQRLGFVPQSNDLYSWMNAEEIITYTSKFYPSWNQGLIDRLMTDWSIPRNRKVSRMSVGEAQKLSIILAMGHEPELLILDEPVASLDPAAKRVFIQQLIELNCEQGNTVLFSTHITSDIERVAADVAIIKSGRSFFHGGIDELKEKVVRLHLIANQPITGLDNLDGVLSCKVTGNEAILTIDNFSPQTKHALEQITGAQVMQQNMNLEDIFVEIAALP